MAKLEEATTEKTDVILFREAVAAAERLIRPWKIIALSLVAAVVLITGGFILYLSQYDFIAEQTVGAAGVFTTTQLGDSHFSVTAQDISPETWEIFMEWLDGQNPSNNN